MLRVEVVMREWYNEETDEISSETYTLDLEHSLLSLSKWEEKYERPFLKDDDKTPEEMLDYYKFMALSDEVPDEVFYSLGLSDLKTINEYIGSRRTATWFSDKNGKPTKEVITSELVYYWIFSYNIPIECEQWFLNRLFTLVKVFSVKNSPPKKKSQSEIAAENRALNAQRKAKLKTKG